MFSVIRGGSRVSVREIVTTVPSRSSLSPSTKVGENRASVYDFQTTAPVRNQDASDVRQNGVVILLGFKNPKASSKIAALKCLPRKGSVRISPRTSKGLPPQP